MTDQQHHAYQIKYAHENGSHVEKLLEREKGGKKDGGILNIWYSFEENVE